MEWIKKGHIYASNNETEEKFSHGKVRAVIDKKTFLRAYTICYSKPDLNGNIIARTFYIDLDRDCPSNIINIGNNSVLTLGNKGEFDEHGVMIEFVIEYNDKLLAFYDGWSRKRDVPYDWAIGLAQSYDGGISFQKLYKGPIISSHLNEPFLFASPEVLIKDGVWHMWYLGGDKWKHYDESNDLYSIYTIKHATSIDGIVWKRNGLACIETKLVEECQAGPTVFQLNDKYHMIFSYRTSRRDGVNGNYELGYAYSEDLIKWIRKDEMIEFSGVNQEWDSNMMCYPRVLKVDDKIFLFYSGNKNGLTGFGYAELFK
jgi:hypothetical protein